MNNYRCAFSADFKLGTVRRTTLFILSSVFCGNFNVIFAKKVLILQ